MTNGGRRQTPQHLSSLDSLVRASGYEKEEPDDLSIMGSVCSLVEVPTLLALTASSFSPCRTCRTQISPTDFLLDAATGYTK